LSKRALKLALFVLCAIGVAVVPMTVAAAKKRHTRIKVHHLANGALVKTATLSFDVGVSSRASVRRVSAFVDGRLFASDTRRPFKFHLNLVGLHVGRHQISIVAYGRKGRHLATKHLSFTLTQDITPPTKPRAFHEVSATDTSITLGWLPSADDTAVSQYRLVGAPHGPVTLAASATGTTVTGLKCRTHYLFHLTAFDGKKHSSGATSTDATTAACGGGGGTIVTVDPNLSQGTSRADVSTQLVYTGILEGVPGGQARLNALHMPLIRIHAGSDAVYAGGPGPELPEGVTKGSWSFAELNSMVDDVYTAGTRPILNVRYAPDWMWSCNTPFTGQTGHLNDPTYVEFGDYMARLVSYYNKGSMKTEAGTTITNPAGTSRRIDWWELWNEPDLSNEDPCQPADGGPALSSQEYLKMWNVVAPKMRAVDPTIKLVGPTVANPNQPEYGPADDYLGTLMNHGNPAPNALSFHSYGYWDNSVTDETLFDGDQTGPGICCGGIPELSWGLQDLRSRFPSIPIYVTEENVNADYGDDPYGRPWGPLGVAWGGSAFRALVLGGGNLMNQYEFANSPQFGYVDDQTGTPYLVYWRDLLLERAFPNGSTILSSGSTAAGIETLAVRRANGSVAVLVIDRQVDSPSAKGGPGVPASVTVDLEGMSPSAVKVTKIDQNTSAASGPSAANAGKTASVPVALAGYGIAVIEVTP
jgi:hypothetical protein